MIQLSEEAGRFAVNENSSLILEAEDDNENSQSLKEFNEIYADFGSCRLNEDINDTTVSAKEFRRIAMNILLDLYDEETYSHVEGTA